MNMRSELAALTALVLLLATGVVRGKLAPVCARAARVQCSISGGNGRNEYNFSVNGKQVFYQFSSGNHFYMRCPENMSVSEPALPRFTEELRVHTVQLDCAPPAAPLTYDAALKALNVTALARLVLRGGELESRHLVGVPWLRDLSLQSVTLKPGSRDLRQLTTLEKLHIQKVNLTSGDLEMLPTGLQQLHLVDTGVGLLPGATFARRPRLARLVLVEKARVAVEPAGALRSLAVESTHVDVSLSLPPTLENVTLKGWVSRRPDPWESCAGLVELQLLDFAIETLPRGWVSACNRLRVLIVQNARGGNTMLEEGVLANATALETLKLMSIGLDTLPKALLDDAPRLRVLSLLHNRLRVLPSGLFAMSRRLDELVLSANRLDSSAMGALAALTSLGVLRLDRNAALEACPADHSRDYHTQRTSSLAQLRNLKELDLSDTRTSRLCADWRALPALRRLRLQRTALSSLEYTDFDFNTKSNVDVDLCDTNVSNVYFHRHDYQHAISQTGRNVTAFLSAPLLCDCNLYWAALALRTPTTRFAVRGAHCADGRMLSQVPVDELVCPAPGLCAANCTCAVRPDEPSPSHVVLQVRCERAALRRVPRVNVTAALAQRASAALDLRLAGNRIDRLAPDDLPPNLLSIDLRGNLLKEIDTATASVLVSVSERRVSLAGNPLECGCGTTGLLTAVFAHPAVFSDRAEVSCGGGGSLATAAPACAEDARAPWIALLALPLVPAVLLALVLCRPELRLRLKAELRARGLLPRAVERDDGRPYDAFVSFSHADEALVRELVARLEGGAAPLRLCVHYRDWVPGGWIHEQIHASVRAARRTVLVVSAEFVRSEWARVEFRAAYAAALRDVEPRLVVVLLDEPERLPLDAELRAYLATNTYVRWGDPWFWDKLRRALPTGRAHPPALPADSARCLSSVVPSCPSPSAVPIETATELAPPVAPGSTQTVPPVAPSALVPTAALMECPSPKPAPPRAPPSLRADA